MHATRVLQGNTPRRRNKQIVFLGQFVIPENKLLVAFPVDPSMIEHALFVQTESLHQRPMNQTVQTTQPALQAHTELAH